MTPAPRVFVPLSKEQGSFEGQECWCAVPPGNGRLWIVALHAAAYAPESRVLDLSIWTAGMDVLSIAFGRGQGFQKVLAVPTFAAQLDPTSIDFQSLPSPPCECTVGARLFARSVGRIERLTVVCTTLEGAGVAAPR